MNVHFAVDSVKLSPFAFRKEDLTKEPIRETGLRMSLPSHIIVLLAGSALTHFKCQRMELGGGR